MYLALDIGGTKTDIGLFQDSEIVYSKKYFNKDYQDFKDLIFNIVKTFTKKQIEAITKVAFAIAGPKLEEDQIMMTVLPWTIKKSEIQNYFPNAKIYFLNDLEAIGYLIPHLNPVDLITIKKSKFDLSSSENYKKSAIIALGTALGESFVVEEQTDTGNSKISIFPSEGGHSRFSPQDNEEIEIMQSLMQTYHSTGIGHLCSANGIKNLYNYYLGKSVNMVDSIDPDNLIFEIIQSANDTLSDTFNLAEAVIKRLVLILATEITNVSFKFLPYNGIFLTGGLISPLTNFLKSSNFIDRIYFQARNTEILVLDKIPIYIIKKDKPTLLGLNLFLKKEDL